MVKYCHLVVLSVAQLSETSSSPSSCKENLSTGASSTCIFMFHDFLFFLQVNLGVKIHISYSVYCVRPWLFILSRGSSIFLRTFYKRKEKESRGSWTHLEICMNISVYIFYYGVHYI